MVICPRCDGNGLVHLVQIKATAEVVHLCDECDALWPSGVAIQFDSFVDFSEYVKPIGLRGRYEEIDRLPDEV